jgi:hypothetical protein
VCSLSFGDAVTCRNDFNAYRNIDKDFLPTREYMLLEELLTALEEKDADKVQAAANGFARTCKF